MKRVIHFTAAFFMVLATLPALAQNTRTASNAEIKTLVSQFYSLRRAGKDKAAAAALLADDFTFTRKGQKPSSKSQFLQEYFPEAAPEGEIPPDLFSPCFELEKELCEYKESPGMIDLKVQPEANRTDFSLVRRVGVSLAIKGEMPDHVNLNRDFAVTVSAVRNGGKWVISALNESAPPDLLFDFPETPEGKKYQSILARLSSITEQREREKNLKKARANAELRDSVVQFFANLELITAKNAPATPASFRDAVTEDFTTTGESSDGSNAKLFPAANAMSMLFRQQLVSTKEFSVFPRGLRVVQNGETIVATYDLLYFRNSDGQKKLEARERHMSVFVRRAGQLKWMADHSAKLPEGEYNETPRGWVAHFPSAYRMGIDASFKHGGNFSTFIKRDAGSDPNKGVEMSQTVDAENFRGKRVQLSGFVKAENVTGGADIYLLPDTDSLQTAGFSSFLLQKATPLADILQKKSRVEGTADWKPVSVTIDVPATAKILTVSVLLRGGGKIWIDDLSLRTVDASTPVDYVVKAENTLLPPNAYAGQPENLDFEDN